MFRNDRPHGAREEPTAAEAIEEGRHRMLRAQWLLRDEIKALSVAPEQEALLTEFARVAEREPRELRGRADVDACLTGRRLRELEIGAGDALKIAFEFRGWLPRRPHEERQSRHVVLDQENASGLSLARLRAAPSLSAACSARVVVPIRGWRDLHIAEPEPPAAGPGLYVAGSPVASRSFRALDEGILEALAVDRHGEGSPGEFPRPVDFDPPVRLERPGKPAEAPRASRTFNVTEDVVVEDESRSWIAAPTAGIGDLDSRQRAAAVESQSRGEGREVDEMLAAAGWLEALAIDLHLEANTSPVEEGVGLALTSDRR